MSEWIWLNGNTLPMSKASISVEDRGFQFADGVYEVIRLYGGKPFALGPHLDRLGRSAAGIQMTPPMSMPKLGGDIRTFLSRYPEPQGMIYLQLTRGVAPRNHVFGESTPTLLFYTRPLPPVPEPGQGPGVRLLALPDERWKRCWIKSIALLPNVLAKNQAVAVDADEAVFIEHERVTECAVSNIFAVIGRKLITHPVGSKVLGGITRSILLELAASVGLEADERAFTEEEALRADELFISSTTREIAWVSAWNDRYIGQAKCGDATRRLHVAYQKKVREEVG